MIFHCPYPASANHILPLMDMTNYLFDYDNNRMDDVDFFKLKSRMNQLGEVKLSVASDSMHPVLKIGQIITVRPSETLNLNRFDIVVYWAQSRLNSHFLWAKQWDNEIEEFVFITKSLNDPTSHDTPIKKNLILGVVDLKLSLFTKIRVWLRNL